MTTATANDAAGTTVNLKPTKVHCGGGWILIIDRETGADIKGFNIPQYGKPDLWAARVVKAMAKLGYEVKTGFGCYGNVVIEIGG